MEMKHFKQKGTYLKNDYEHLQISLASQPTLKKKNYFYFIYKSILPACMYCSMCVPGACRGQITGSNLLEQEFQLVISYNVGSENSTQVL